MDFTLASPRQPSSAPILAVSILLGLLLSPVLERALESWMPGTGMASDGQQKSRGPGRNSDNRKTRDLRSM